MRSASATLVLLLALGGCDKRGEQAPQPNAAVAAPAAKAEAGVLDMSKRGSAMPGDGFTGPRGEPLTLAKFKGKPVLVNLWATWCAPCVREMPSLDRLAAAAQGKLAVVAVNQDAPQAKDPVPGWWNGARLSTLELYRDPKNDLGFSLGGGQLPTSVLYDAQGRELWRFSGGLDWTSARAQAMLKDVLPQG